MANDLSAIRRSLLAPDSQRRTFTYFLDLLAKHKNSSAVKLFSQRFPYHKIKDTVNGLSSSLTSNTFSYFFNLISGISLSTNDGLEFTPEELISMVLSKAKTFAEDSSKQVINDCVITVPPYFTQAERRAVLLAADLAKLKVLQLINTKHCV